MQRVPLYRVVVFVPVPALEAVKQGILAVDALVAGDYEHGMWWSAPGFEQFLVASQSLMVCLPRTHPLATAASIHLQDLQAQALVVGSRTVSPDYHERILAECELAGWLPTVVHELRHWLSVVALVAQGQGVALVPQALARSALAGAVFVPLQDCNLRYDTRCLWHSGRDQTALQDFVAILRNEAALAG